MMRILLLLSLSFILVISQSPLTTQELQNLYKFIKPGTSLKDIHLATACLLKLGGKLGEYGTTTETMCPQLTAQVPTDPKNLFHLSASLSAYNCEKANFVKIEQNILENLSKLTTQDIFYTSRSIFFLRKKLKSLHTDKVVLKKLFDVVFARFDANTGLFCQTKTASCFEETGIAYSVLTTLSSLLQGEDLISSFVKVAAKVNLVISAFSSVPNQPISSISALVSGLNKLSDIVPLKTKISQEEVENFKNEILKKRAVSNLEQLYDFIEAISTISNSNIHTLIYTSNFVADKVKKVAKISISDYLGRPYESVKLSKVFIGSDEDDLVAENVVLNPVGTEYTWDFTTQNFDSGLVNLEYSVSKNGKEFQKFTHIIKYDTNIKIKDSRLILRKKKEFDGLTFRVKHPETLQQQITVTQEDTFSFAMNVVDTNDKDFIAQQVFLRLIHSASQIENTFLLRRINQEYRTEIDIQKASTELFKLRGGEYEVELVVADEIIKQPIFWKIGKVFFNFGESSASKTKAEIYHVFKQQSKRPPTIISRLFSLVVLVPLFIFIMIVLSLGPNLKGCNSFILSFLFQLSILAMIGVIFLYWTQLTIFEAFGYLLGIGVFSLFVGTYSMKK